jgi:hypothetical protein
MILDEPDIRRADRAALGADAYKIVEAEDGEDVGPAGETLPRAGPCRPAGC